ncbi:hypothetical protein CspHIS471_0303420 [Cutaneotrichosporon sp. HIS471]|nr:hypothetical protein CspHIS471_0303420 [Cutaneotrichosporon sp. HIS471]
MLYSNFQARLDDNLADYGLTVEGILRLPHFQSIDRKQKTAIMSSIHAALDTRPDLLVAWMAEIASPDEPFTSFASILFILMHQVVTSAEDDAKQAESDAAVKAEAATARAVAAAQDKCKAEAHASTKAAVAEAVAETKAEASKTVAMYATMVKLATVSEHGICVVCQDKKADTMPHACNHVIMCDDCAKVLHRTGSPCPGCKETRYREGQWKVFLI